MRHTLSTRPLGRSGVEITLVGFGAWAAGGGGWAFGWGPQDDEESIASMRHALDLGVNWIDTAAVYGLGHSEEVVGRLLKSLPSADRPLVFTKCGLQWDDNDRMMKAKRSLRPEGIRTECDDALRRLGVERIDLFQFHWPDESGVPIEDSWGAMLGLVEAGKVRLAGLSNFDTTLLDRCEALGHVDSLQAPYSLIRRGLVEREIPWCIEHGSGVLCYSPMQTGILTDSFSRDRIARMADDDWRRQSPEFQEPKLSSNIALRDALRPIAQRHETTVSAIAVAWTIATPGVTGAIVGARSPAQVDGWIDAARVQLTEGDLAEIADATSAQAAPQPSGANSLNQ
jgi:aryl-alcohol dehydrogenase-like predicted oxidoreductase